MQTNFSEAGSEGTALPLLRKIPKNFLLKILPLIDIEKQGGPLSNKQMRNLKNITMLKAVQRTIYKKGMVCFQD